MAASVETLPDPNELFDWAGVLVLVDDDAEMAKTLLENFLETERGTLDKVREYGTKAAAATDWVALRTSAHSLKGSSSYMCAKLISTLSNDIQSAAEAQNKLKVDELLPQLIAHFDRAEVLMRSKLAEL
jgi:HPt (histidine-containing phosphotransfer) domain-containing protein